MSRINCHSAFKHYDMFHSHGGDSINIGSNNTTIFNCGGHSGGFWSGVGLGLGNAFGSIFSGMLGNFGGFGLGGFGFGGFGMGGFGFGGFPSFGGFGYGNYSGYDRGINSNRSKRTNDTDSDSNTSGKAKKDSPDDPDCKKIADITGKIKDLPADADKNALDSIIKDIDTAIENLDNNNKPAQKRTLENLKKELENRAKGLDEAAKKPATAATTEKTEVPPATTAAAQNASDTGKTNATEPQYGGKTIDEIKAMSPDDLKAFLEKLSPEDRAKVKASFYLKGYKNYDGKTTVTKDNFKVIHDTGLGNKADISNVVDVEAGTPPKTIKMKTTNKPQEVTYTYQETKDGEYLYKSNAGGQTYVLQQNGSEFTLVQYKYHDGWNKVDVHQK